MANDKNFSIKNGLQAGRYLQTGGTETAGSTFDVSSTAYDSVAFSVSSQATFPQSVRLKTDGTSMYVLDNTNKTVYQYTLSTAWDMSTASYASKSFSVVSQESSEPTGLFFKPDGTKMYVAGNGTDSVFQYNLSTAWDVSTASYESKSFSFASQSTLTYEVLFNADGTKMYDVSNTSGTIFQYSLSTAWDVSTASYDSVSLNTSAVTSNPSGAVFVNSGSTLLVVDVANDLYEYSLTTPYVLSTANYASKTLDVSGQDAAMTGVEAIDGSTGKVYLSGKNDDNVYQYSGSSYTQSLDLSTGTYFSFTPSGSTTVSFTNAPASGKAVGFAVEINGDGSAITWPTSVKWPSGVAPTATASKEVYAFVTTDGGTSYYGKRAAEGIL